MKRRKSETEIPFVQLSRAFFESVALAAVSLAARRILNRLIAEHLTHYGKANGRLAASYERFAAHAGVDKSDVSSALAELVDVGLIFIQHGLWSTSTKRFPNRYRLTCEIWGPPTPCSRRCQAEGIALYVTHLPNTSLWQLDDGTQISEAAARIVVTHPNIIGVGDCLIDDRNASQTFRFVEEEGEN
jgi:hypothetical protein